MTHIGWTKERVEEVKKLWAAGLSASQVAAELGGGATRNAVIGKVHRIGLVQRDKTKCQPLEKPKKQKPRPFTAPLPEVEMQPLPEDQIAVQTSGRVTIMGLSATTCRWPVEHTGGGWLFCGCTAQFGKPYCESHARIAYPSGPPRKAAPEAIAARKAGMWKALARAR